MKQVETIELVNNSLISAIDKLHQLTHVPIPYPLKGIKDKEVRFKEVVDKEDILDVIAARVKDM